MVVSKTACLLQSVQQAGALLTNSEAVVLSVPVNACRVWVKELVRGQMNECPGFWFQEVSSITSLFEFLLSYENPVVIG